MAEHDIQYVVIAYLWVVYSILTSLGHRELLRQREPAGGLSETTPTLTDAHLDTASDASQIAAQTSVVTTTAVRS